MLIELRRFAVILMLCALLVAMGNGKQASAQELGRDPYFDKPAPTERQLAAISTAIKDEIYEFSQQGSFFKHRRGTTGANAHIAHLDLYIRPQLSRDGGGQVIYDNLPYGEIVRFFYILDDGLVHLTGGKGVGFPMTQPSHLTIFENKVELARSKANWIHRDVAIYEHPHWKVARRAKSA